MDCGSTWYSHLTKLICENRRRDDLSNVFDNLSFVSFNYDRCIERYLPKSIANYYGIDAKEVENYSQALRIHRPYGIAGRLPWQNGDMALAEFGSENVESLASVALEIRTFTQGMGDVSKQGEMHNDLVEAERIVFLGSAFHRQNLELLKIPGNKDVEVLATASGISQNDQRIVKNELAEILGIPRKSIADQIALEPVYCEKLFVDNWRRLTAGPRRSSYSLLDVVG